LQQLPKTENALVLRTDFTDDTMWRRVCVDIQKPVGGFQASVEFLDAPQYEGITVEQLPALVPPETNCTFMFIVDGVTISLPENPILVVNLATNPPQSFRTIPSEMWGIENNLPIGNMDFEEFANSVSSDGVFRGFPRG
jgi:hypothetical protein